MARETDNSKRGRELLVRQRIRHDRRRHLLRQRRVSCEWPETEDRGNDDDVSHKTHLAVPDNVRSSSRANAVATGSESSAR